MIHGSPDRQLAWVSVVVLPSAVRYGHSGQWGFVNGNRGHVVAQQGRMSGP